MFAGKNATAPEFWKEHTKKFIREKILNKLFLKVTYPYITSFLDYKFFQADNNPNFEWRNFLTYTWDEKQLRLLYSFY